MQISQTTNSQLNFTNGVNIDNRGLAYGDGFFTTMGVRQGQILWANYHLQRMQTHAKALELDVNANELMQVLANQAQKIGEGILKLVVTRKPQAVRGYGFTTGEVDVAIKALPTSIYSNLSHFNSSQFEEEAIPVQPSITAICLTAQIACLPQSLVGLKTLNRLDNVLAAGELEQLKQKYQNHGELIGEGLVRDVSGNWVEGVMSNVFYQLADSETWYTPPIDKSGVNGVMRQVVLDRVENITERTLIDADLAHISALFFTNAVRGIIPVSDLILPDTKRVQLSTAYNF